MAADPAGVSRLGVEQAAPEAEALPGAPAEQAGAVVSEVQEVQEVRAESMAALPASAGWARA